MSFTSRFGNYQVADEPWYRSQGGVANGVATLDGTGVVPTSQLPASIVGALKYKGTWNATTNTPTLSNGGGGGDLGDYYVVNVAGTTSIDGISDWEVGDWIVNNGSLWEKIDNTDVVTSVNSKVGAVTLDLSEILAQGNTTGANNISITAGQTLNFNVGSGGALNSVSTTAVRAWNLPDASGTIALTSDIVTETLAQTLAAGNTTGGTNISMTTTDRILFGDAGRSVGFDDSVADYITFATEDDGFLFGNATQLASGLGFLIDGGNIKIQTSQPNILFTRTGDLGSLQLQTATITAGRTQTFQDATGTIALTSDIPATPTLSAVLTAGNTTGANNIIVSASTGVRAIVSDTADAYRLQFGATSIGLRKGDFLKGNIDLNANQLNLRYSDTIANYVNFYMNTPTTTTGIFEFTTTMSAGAELRVGNNVDFILVEGASALTLTRNLTADRSQAFQDASGTIALLSDIPATPTTLYTGDGSIPVSTNRTITLPSTSNLIVNDGTNDLFKVFGVGAGQFGAFNGTIGGLQIDWANDRIAGQKTGTAFEGRISWSTITASRDYTLPDASGTIALTSDIPSTPTLSAVLTAGNTTGGNNILVTSGQDIRSNTSGNTLNLDDPAAQVSNVAWSITQDNGAYGSETAWIYGETNNGIQVAYQLANSPLEAIGIGVYSSGITPLIYTGKEVVVTDNRTASANSGNIDKRATFIGARNSTINTGVVNAVIAGATGITATTGNALYTNQLRLQSSANSFDGIVDIATLTATRTYTFQDASGTIAFLSDITGAGNLSSVLAAGNTTGGTNISMTSGDTIDFNVGSGGSLNSASTAAARTWNLPDASGTIALTSDIPTSVLSVTGTANRIAITGTAQNPIVNIATTYVGQTSITTLGTITTGTWNGTAIAATRGGTGTTTYTTGNILYASATNVLSKLAIGSAGTFLRSNGTIPQWSGVSLPNSASTGDILYASSANNYSNLSAGTNGQVLTLAGGVPTWATPSTGGVTGSGTTNKSAIWTSASTIGSGALTDNGTRLSLNDTAVTLNMFTLTTDSSAQFGILSTAQNSVISNTSFRALASGGVTATGLDVNVGASSSASIGVNIVANTSSSGTNTGLKVTAANAGAGNAYAIQLLDGTEGAGKILTSDASGRGTWQTPTSTWRPNSIPLGSLLASGATYTINTGSAGVFISFSGTADDTIYFNDTLNKAGLDYDGSDLAIKIHMRIPTNGGAGDTVGWVLTYALYSNGDITNTGSTTLSQQNVDVSTWLADEQNEVTLGTMTGVSGADTIMITLTRNSSGAGADAYSGAAEVLALEFTKP